MRISAKADYAVRAAVQLAIAPDDQPTKGDAIATAQVIPLKFLEKTSRPTCATRASCAPSADRRAGIG